MELLSDQQMAFKAVWAILNTNSKIYVTFFGKTYTNDISLSLEN